MDEKINLILLYGGRSTEHEISCRSAAFVVKNHDPSKYNLKTIAISKDGRFLPQDPQNLIKGQFDVLPICEKGQYDDDTSKLFDLKEARPEGLGHVVFPLLHGTYGEDGCMQGFLELCDLAYIGCDPLGSASSMDKVVTKELVKAAQIPVVPSVWLRQEEWLAEKEKWLQRIADALRFPLFVKPANLGSSVGISKVEAFEGLGSALEEAFTFDEKVLVEVGLKVREIEFAAMGGHDPLISVGGESVAKTDFYDYAAKYEDEKASEVVVPADISQSLQEEGRRICKKVYQCLNLYGLARIDLFLTADDKYYLNEVNTMPGFTSISQFPLLWRHAGLSERDIIDRLVESALKRARVKRKLSRSFKNG